MAYIISFEGMDGSGKTTVAKNLAEVLKSEFGLNAKYVKFPNYDCEETGKDIMNFLDRPYSECDPEEVMDLFETNRRNYMLELLLKEYEVLVLDRYILSNVTTHGPHRENMFNIEDIWERAQNEVDHSHSFTINPVHKPDLMFIVTRDPVEAHDDIVNRSGGAKDVENLEMLKRTKTLLDMTSMDTFNVYADSIRILDQDHISKFVEDIGSGENRSFVTLARKILKDVF